MLPAEQLVRAVHATSRERPADGDVVLVRERLAWAEAFTRVWDRLVADTRQGSGPGPALPRDRSVEARLVAELGFSLTPSQTRAVAAIAKDLEGTTPMRRLLLGDVGTGKTAVALAAAAQCVAAGGQVAVLVPTSILAEQYMDAAAPLARATGARIALFAAGVPAAQRRRATELAASGAIHVAVGTHALLSEPIVLPRLGLVIVDEQHRLGVAQRLALVKKASVRPHLLTLSATPIPRTLALALRGELATSTLDERPQGRPPVTTELVARSRFADVVESLRSVCTRGERAFLVTLRIDEEDEEDDEPRLDGRPDGAREGGAVARAAELERLLAPARVALVHGALSPEAKRRAMRAFRAGEVQVLVGTTVVEVGIDVPEATLMVVDGAENFGLAQLHQLRGRVGRGDRAGHCMLVHDEPLSELAKRRLLALRDTTDGAVLARADLELRGAGDLGGTRQSGAEPEFLYLDAGTPPDWLERIERDARAIFAADPELAHEEHRGLALAVRRFETAMAVREEAG
jgi:ATP-dependent DNA helicase RecG